MARAPQLGRGTRKIFLFRQLGGWDHSRSLRLRRSKLRSVSIVVFGQSPGVANVALFVVSAAFSRALDSSDLILILFRNHSFWLKFFSWSASSRDIVFEPRVEGRSRDVRA
jgi:hypothetical protein